ncbi:MAG: hybrid sensor histidine kinase/response regulator, partial [Bacillota bacterium]
IVIHCEGRIVFANSAALKLLGAGAMDDIYGKPVLDFIHEDYKKLVLQRIGEVEQGKVVPILEEKLIRLDGKVLDCEILITPFQHQGKPAVLVIVRDITEQKQMEQELLKADRLEALRLLAGGIAHDFNNILTIILGNISLAKISVRSNEKIYRKLEEIKKATLQAKELTQQLLTLAKGGAPVKKTVSLGDFLRETVVFALRGSNVLAEFTLPDDLWLVEIDENQMSQVIYNLVINAVQAMPSGGVIQVKTENISHGREETAAVGISLCQRNYVKISIEDQGIGIGREYLHKIFDPYFTTKQKGSGLGLATSYSIIKKHEGHISVESEVGRGTTFHIYLPASLGKNANPEMEEEELLLGKGTVLVMEDDPAIVNIAAEMLQLLGYEARFAGNGREALAMFQEAKEAGTPFACVIMDLTIRGGMGGRDVIEKIRQIDPTIKAIVASGYSNDPVLADHKRYGFHGVVAKPYEVKTLGKVLQKVLNEEPF